MSEKLNYREVYLDPVTVKLLHDTGEAIQCGYNFCFAADNQATGVDVYRSPDGTSKGAVFLSLEDINLLADSEPSDVSRCVRIPRAAFNAFDPADHALVDTHLSGADGLAIHLSDDLW